MSPFTSPAIIAYGTLAIGWRGVISGSVPTVIPIQRCDPSKILSPNGTIEPSGTEKYPCSKVTGWTSLQIGSPELALS
jgi:hypothetical protein